VEDSGEGDTGEEAVRHADTASVSQNDATRAQPKRSKRKRHDGNDGQEAKQDSAARASSSSMPLRAVPNLKNLHRVPAGLTNSEPRYPRLKIDMGHPKHETEEGVEGKPAARFAELGFVAPYPPNEDASYDIHAKPDDSDDSPDSDNFERSFVDPSSHGFMCVQALPRADTVSSSSSSESDTIRDKTELKQVVEGIIEIADQNEKAAPAGDDSKSYEATLDERLRGSKHGGVALPLNLFTAVLVESGFCRSTDGAWLGQASTKPDIKRGVRLTRSRLTYGVGMRHPTAESKRGDIPIYGPASIRGAGKGGAGKAQRQHTLVRRLFTLANSILKKTVNRKGKRNYRSWFGAIVTSDAGAAEQAVHTDTLPWPLRRPQRGSERRPQHEQQQGGEGPEGWPEVKKGQAWVKS